MKTMSRGYFEWNDPSVGHMLYVLFLFLSSYDYQLSCAGMVTSGELYTFSESLQKWNRHGRWLPETANQMLNIT